MIRHLAYLAPLALLSLAACDGPQALTKAKEGECFVMSGREPGGAQKWEKADCASAGAITVPVEEVQAIDPATGQPVVATGAAPVCPAVTTCSTASAAAGSGGSYTRAERRSRRAAQQASKSTRSSRASRTETDYARVYTEDRPPLPLLGGYERNDSYEYSNNNPPAPPAPRFEQRERRSSEDLYGYGEQRSDQYSSGQGSHVQGRHAPPPPPADDYRYGGAQSGGQAQGYRSEQYSSSESYGQRSYSSSGSRSSSTHSGSSSSTGSSSGGGYATGGGCCGRPAMAPMNGPHFPVDQDGYLTWRGKTPRR